MTASLYNIAAEYQAAAARLLDLDLPDEVVADTLEGMAGDFENKGQQVAFVIRNLDSEADQIDLAIADMQKRSKAKHARASSVRKYLLDNMLATGISKIDCPFFKVSVRDNPESVVIDCEAEVAPDYWREIPATRQPDKVLIKKAIKDGYTVPGAHLARSQRLDIK